MFSENDIKSGINYIQEYQPNVYPVLLKYKFTDEEHKLQRIICLDNFNMDIKWDLEKLIGTGSCFGLSSYLYKLIYYIQNSEIKIVYFHCDGLKTT